MSTYHNMNIIVQTTVGYASSLNGKSESPNKTLDNITSFFCWTQATINNFGVLHISMSYGYPAKLMIDCVVMFLTFYGIEQDLHIKISEYGVWESTSSVEVLQEINLRTGHIRTILWDMKLLQESIYTGNQINHLSFTETIMFVLLNTILSSS